MQTEPSGGLPNYYARITGNIVTGLTVGDPGGAILDDFDRDGSLDVLASSSLPIDEPDGAIPAVIHSKSFAERGLFDAGEVQAVYRRFCEGEGRNAFFVWQWINTEMWFRRFADARLPQHA